jgi:hypothetical protein
VEDAGMRVLIVEDDLRMASLVRRGLAGERLAADVASTGEDALWIAQAHPYDATALDRELRVRAQDLAVVAGDPHTSLARAADSRFVEHGESYAQLLAPDGRVLEATIPLGGTPLLDARQIAAARRRAIYLDKHSVPGLDEPSRLLATSVGRGVIVVGATKQAGLRRSPPSATSCARDQSCAGRRRLARPPRSARLVAGAALGLPICKS